MPKIRKELPVKLTTSRHCYRLGTQITKLFITKHYILFFGVILKSQKCLIHWDINWYLCLFSFQPEKVEIPAKYLPYVDNITKIQCSYRLQHSSSTITIAPVLYSVLLTALCTAYVNVWTLNWVYILGHFYATKIVKWWMTVPVWMVVKN